MDGYFNKQSAFLWELFVLADLFLYSYEAEFIQGLMKAGSFLFLWMTPRIGYTFGALAHSLYSLAHSLYTGNSLNPQDIEAWKYYYNLRIKQTSTKNSGPGKLVFFFGFFFNKCTDALVMSPDSEGLGAAVDQVVFHISPYTLLSEVFASVMILGRNSFWSLSFW